MVSLDVLAHILDDLLQPYFKQISIGLAESECKLPQYLELIQLVLLDEVIYIFDHEGKVLLNKFLLQVPDGILRRLQDLIEGGLALDRKVYHIEDLLIFRNLL